MSKTPAGDAAAEDQTGRFVAQPNGRVRPLSPHLQVWRWHVTMTASILHRITGSGLIAGVILVALWLGSLAFGPDAYDQFVGLAGSPLGLFVWIGLTLAAFYHLFSGVRHLIWDTGAGLAPKTADALAWVTIIGAVLATVGFWALLFATGRVQL